MNQIHLQTQPLFFLLQKNPVHIGDLSALFLLFVMLFMLLLLFVMVCVCVTVVVCDGLFVTTVVCDGCVAVVAVVVCDDVLSVLQSVPAHADARPVPVQRRPGGDTTHIQALPVLPRSGVHIQV